MAACSGRCAWRSKTSPPRVRQLRNCNTWRLRRHMDERIHPSHLTVPELEMQRALEDEVLFMSVTWPKAHELTVSTGRAASR